MGPYLVCIINVCNSWQSISWEISLFCLWGPKTWDFHRNGKGSFLTPCFLFWGSLWILVHESRKNALWIEHWSSRASFGTSGVRIQDKIDRVLIAPHWIQPPQSMIFGDIIPFQKPRELLGFYSRVAFYLTEDRFWPDLADIKLGYKKEFYQSYSFFISQWLCLRTSKFRCLLPFRLLSVNVDLDGKRLGSFPIQVNSQ